MEARVKQHAEEALAERGRRKAELERKFHEQDRGSDAARELKQLTAVLEERPIWARLRMNQIEVEFGVLQKQKRTHDKEKERYHNLDEGDKLRAYHDFDDKTRMSKLRNSFNLLGVLKKDTVEGVKHPGVKMPGWRVEKKVQNGMESLDVRRQLNSELVVKKPIMPKSVFAGTTANDFKGDTFELAERMKRRYPKADLEPDLGKVS
jgi:hypothetical protein